MIVASSGTMKHDKPESSSDSDDYVVPLNR